MFVIIFIDYRDSLGIVNMKLFQNDLMHFSPDAGIAFAFREGQVCAVEPPFDVEDAYPVEIKPNEGHSLR